MKEFLPKDVIPFIPYRGGEYQQWLDKSIEDLDVFTAELFDNAVNLATRGCWRREDSLRSPGELFEVSEGDLRNASDPLVARLGMVIGELQTALEELAGYSDTYRSGGSGEERE